MFCPRSTLSPKLESCLQFTCYSKLPDRLLQSVAILHDRHYSQMENVGRLATANKIQYEWAETSHQNLTSRSHCHQHHQRAPRYPVSSFGHRELYVGHSWHQQCPSLVILLCSMDVFPTIVTYTPPPSQDGGRLPSQGMESH